MERINKDITSVISSEFIIIKNKIRVSLQITDIFSMDKCLHERIMINVENVMGTRIDWGELTVL